METNIILEAVFKSLKMLCSVYRVIKPFTFFYLSSKMIIGVRMENFGHCILSFELVLCLCMSLYPINT